MPGHSVLNLLTCLRLTEASEVNLNLYRQKLRRFREMNFLKSYNHLAVDLEFEPILCLAFALIKSVMNSFLFIYP